MITERSAANPSDDELGISEDFSFETPHLISYTDCIFGISLGQKLDAQPEGFDATCVNPTFSAFYYTPSIWSGKELANVQIKTQSNYAT